MNRNKPAKKINKPRHRCHFCKRFTRRGRKPDIRVCDGCMVSFKTPNQEARQ